MASFTSISHEPKVPLPCHFDPAEFTSGPTDNWDHEGTTSIHDDVTVLYQTKPKSPAGAKPKISETNCVF